MNGRLERVGKTGECEAGGREDCGTERESDGDVGWKCEKWAEKWGECDVWEGKEIEKSQVKWEIGTDEKKLEEGENDEMKQPSSEDRGRLIVKEKMYSWKTASLEIVMEFVCKLKNL
jgi:hypothetical protein